MRAGADAIMREQCLPVGLYGNRADVHDLRVAWHVANHVYADGGDDRRQPDGIWLHANRRHLHARHDDGHADRNVPVRLSNSVRLHDVHADGNGDDDVPR